MKTALRLPRTMPLQGGSDETALQTERRAVDELGAGFWLKMIGVIFAIGIAGLVVFFIIGAAWYAWGFLGAFLFVVAVLAVIAWSLDRSRARRYDDLSDA
jgi:Flp pilus assembly protein TadB